MDEIIAKILKMDETARKMDEEAQAERIASQEEVKKKRREVYEKYLESAKEHIETYKESEKKTYDAQWKKSERHFADISKELDRKFRANKDKWVEEIVNGVLSYSSL